MISSWEDTLVGLMAAWLLLAGVAYISHRQQLGLSRNMLIASIRGPVQLLALAFVLHWIFDISSHWAQAGIILFFCVLAAQTSSSHHPKYRKQAWIATTVGLSCACVLTLPWLVFAGVIDNDTRTLIPLGSMVAANGMNAVSIMFERLNSGSDIGKGMSTALIPTIDTLRVVGLVHMPGIFVGMILAGSSPIAAASAQLIVLYMIVASSFSACMVSFLMIKYFNKARAYD